MKKNILFPLLVATAIVFCIFSFTKVPPVKKINHTNKNVTDDAGLTLPNGFSASLVANDLGEVRHIAITKEGDIYAKLGRAKNGKGIVFLKDNNGNLQEQNGFGDYGGTAMRIHNGYLYA